MNIKKDVNIEENFIDIARKACDLIGAKETWGQVYVLLYLSEQPLSLDDITERTGLSKSNVWATIQSLITLAAAKKVRTNDNRKDYFIAEKDFNLILTRGIIPLLKTKMAIMESYIDGAGHELNNYLRNKQGEGISNKNYQDLLDEMLKQKSRLEALLNFFPGE